MNAQQIAAEAAMQLWDKWSNAINEEKYVATDTMETIILSAIEKATKEHQAEHDRLQRIIENDTFALMAEKEKSRILGNLVEGLRKAAHASEFVPDPESFVPIEDQRELENPLIEKATKASEEPRP